MRVCAHPLPVYERSRLFPPREITANRRKERKQEATTGTKSKGRRDEAFNREWSFHPLRNNKLEGGHWTNEFDVHSLKSIGYNHAFSTILFRVFLASKETECVQRGRATCFPSFGRGAYVYNCARVHSSCFNQEIDLRKVLERFCGHLRIVWIHSWLHFRFCFYTKPIFTVDDRERKRCQSETKLFSNIRTRTTCIIVSMSLCNDVCRVFCIFRAISLVYVAAFNHTPGKRGAISVALQFLRNNMARLIPAKTWWPPFAYTSSPLALISFFNL